jgi:hypothetical protein
MSRVDFESEWAGFVKHRLHFLTVFFLKFNQLGKMESMLCNL